MHAAARRNLHMPLLAILAGAIGALLLPRAASPDAQLMLRGADGAASGGVDAHLERVCLERIEAALAAADAALPSPLPPQPQPPPPPPPSLVLGMARGIDASSAYRFVRSLRAAMPYARAVVFTDAASLAADASLRGIYESFGATLVEFDLARDVPPAAAAWHPSSYRWLLMRDWLRAHVAAAAPGADAGAIFFADVRDAVFQGDVFAAAAERGGEGAVPLRGFFAFKESRHLTIAADPVNRDWVKDCFGATGLADVGGNVISCSGTSLGEVRAALAYAEAMSETLMERRSCERMGVDQGVHNFLVYSGVLAARLEALAPVAPLALISNEDGFVATVQTMPELVRDRAGRVLNAAAVPYAVVHQYDRSPALKRQYAGEYVWLNDAELREK
jgi:hypothetical protein